MNSQWKQIIESTWKSRTLLEEQATQDCIRTVIEEIDKGRLRTAEPTTEGWKVNDWVKKQSSSTSLFNKLKPPKLAL